MKKLFTLSVLVLLFFSALKFVSADDLKTLKEETFSSSNGKELIVTMQSGDVKIISGVKQEVYVKILGNDNAKEYYEYSSKNDGGNISIEVRLKKSAGILNNVELKAEIMLPSEFNVNVTTAGGDINLSGISGITKLTTAGGDIKCDNINGKSDLTTAGGDIKCDNIKGNIEANTSGGDIKIKCSDGSIEAKTSGGDVKVEYSGVNYGMKLKTMGGDIRLSVPTDFAANAELATMGGSIKTDFGLEVKEKNGKSKAEGILNGGGKIIECSTMGGDVILSKLK